MSILKQFQSLLLCPLCFKSTTVKKNCSDDQQNMYIKYIKQSLYYFGPDCINICQPCYFSLLDKSIICTTCFLPLLPHSFPPNPTKYNKFKFKNIFERETSVGPFREPEHLPIYVLSHTTFVGPSHHCLLESSEGERRNISKWPLRFNDTVSFRKCSDCERLFISDYAWSEFYCNECDLFQHCDHCCKRATTSCQPCLTPSCDTCFSYHSKCGKSGDIYE